VERTFPTPDAASQADDPTSRVTEVVAVEYSPDGRFALVFLEYNGWMPYEQLCERTDSGWVGTTGTSGGGQGWKLTHEDPARGPLDVVTEWCPPSAHWDVEPPHRPGPPGRAEPW
jgi:hypothetical protein